MFRAGEARHQISIQSRSTVQDAAGEPANTWTEYASRRASIQRTPGKEAFAAAQDNGRIPVVFRLRWLDGVTPAMRVVFDSKVFDIRSIVDVDGRKAELMLTCDERVGEAP